MPEIVVKTQKEWDALPASFKEFTVIKIISTERITILKCADSSRAELWGSSSAVLRDSSRAELWGSSSAELWGSSSAELWGSSSAVLRDSSRAELWGSSSAELWGSSSAVLRDSSSAELRDSSRAELWGSSSAELWDSSSAHNHSKDAKLLLFSYAVAWLFNKAKAVKKSRTSTIITPVVKKGETGWLEGQGIKVNSGKVILFKRVSKEFKTRENTDNETKWPVGNTITHKDWNPGQMECGEGKFHACSRPYFCDEFRSLTGDLYIAIEIAKADLYAWPNPKYQHKIAFRKGNVLYECDRFGDQIKK